MQWDFMEYENYKPNLKKDYKSDNFYRISEPLQLNVAISAGGTVCSSCDYFESCTDKERFAKTKNLTDLIRNLLV